MFLSGFLTWSMSTHSGTHGEPQIVVLHEVGERAPAAAPLHDPSNLILQTSRDTPKEFLGRSKLSLGQGIRTDRALVLKVFASLANTGHGGAERSDLLA